MQGNDQRKDEGRREGETMKRTCLKARLKQNFCAYSNNTNAIFQSFRISQNCHFSYCHEQPFPLKLGMFLKSRMNRYRRIY